MNCFTTVYKHLSKIYNLPKKWEGYTDKDMDIFVKEQKRFLASRKHIKFFMSFCHKVNKPKANDIVLTDRSVGCAINSYTYWVYNEDKKDLEFKKIDKDCLILRVNNG